VEIRQTLTIFPGEKEMKTTKMLAILVLALGLAVEVATADFTFGTPTNLGPVVNSPGADGSPNISADGLTLYFDSLRPSGFGDWDIWVATRENIDDDWSAPEPLPAPVNSVSADAGPSISADGLSLYFASKRSGGFGSFDIWVTRRKTTEEPWGEPENLGPPVNSGTYDNHPNISADGLTLYFGSLSWFGLYDLYVTERPTTDSKWRTPVNLGPEVNSFYYELSPNISSDGLSLFFDRRGASGDRDILIATRGNLADDWGIQQLYGPPLNTLYNDTDPSISFDGTMLYFASYRPGGFGGQDLWQVSIAPVRAIPDFNNDGIVNLKDFCKLAQYWLQHESSVDISPPPEGDGKVDYKDLAGLAEYWLTNPGLLAHWKLDETEGDIVSDSANDNDGTVYGDPAWQPQGGMVDGALQLDGIDDYVNTPFVLNPADGKFSVFVWIKGGAPGQAVVSQIGGARWLCADPSEGNLMTELKATGRGANELLSQTVITDGNWRRIGLVWDGSHRTLYVDDVAVAEDTQDGLGGSDSGLYIGADTAMEPGSFWSGLIDDVRIYNWAVTP
jgi:Tol biopolymer transport system component